jgi:two-component system sensor histidine kinase YesM
MKINFLSKSLKNKLIFSHIITVIIVTILIEIIIYAVAVNMQLKDAKSFDSQMVNQISNSLDNMIVSFKRVLNYVSMNRDLQELLKIDYQSGVDEYQLYALNNKLQSIAVEQTIFVNEIDSLYLYDKKALRVYFKRYYKHNEEEKYYPVPDDKYFAQNGSITWRVDGKTVAFNRIIKDLDSQKNIGYLTVTMHKNYIQEKINAIRSNQNRFIIITDEFDNVIVHNYEEGEENLSKILKSIKNFKEYKNQQSKESSIQDIESIGKSLVTTYQSDFSRWKIISFIAISELTKGPAVMARWIYYVGISGLIIGVIISLISSNRLVKPVNLLTYLMDEVEKENFDVRIKINSNDELGRLGTSFNNMVEKINNLISKVYQEEIKLKNAEIKALQAQINPHFLYNTLDCINWLAEFGKTNDIRCVTIALANLMKASANNKKKMIAVANELENIKAYLSIYKISLQDKFQYYIDVDEKILELYIPKLILQPLVENAIIHGLKKKIGQGNLHIKGFFENDQIIFQVFDDGVGISPGKRESIFTEANEENKSVQGTGSGLQNVRDRIKLIYGEQYGIHIESSEGIGTMVEINMPVQTREGE